jgi:hypothetical protein
MLKHKVCCHLPPTLKLKTLTTSLAYSSSKDTSLRKPIPLSVENSNDMLDYTAGIILTLLA